MSRWLAQAERIPPRDTSSGSAFALSDIGVRIPGRKRCHLLENWIGLTSYDATLDLSGYTNNIRIYWGSQTGTAQWFAQDLQNRLMERATSDNCVVSVHGMQDLLKQQQPSSPPNDASRTFYVLLVSVTGVGQPPDNARKFFQRIMSDNDADSAAATSLFHGQPYVVFGLGDAKAHPSHYNVIGKALDERLQSLGGIRVLPIGLGDDGGASIEDDFDDWVDRLCSRIDSATSNNSASPTSSSDEATKFPRIVFDKPDIKPNEPHNFVHRQMQVLQSDAGQATSFYPSDTTLGSVAHNRMLNPLSGESGLREMRLVIPSSVTTPFRYETGDHVLVYPENSASIVQAYMRMLTENWGLDVPNDGVSVLRIQDANDGSGHKQQRYPHPTDISLQDTLTHCVNLGAPPSPNMVRLILDKAAERDGSSVPWEISASNDKDRGSDDGMSFDAYYKTHIVDARRTVLDMLQEHRVQLSLEELLFHLPRMKPRYYSIASSPLEDSSNDSTSLVLTYRPVKYVTPHGHFRQGVATNYLASLGSPGDALDISNMAGTAPNTDGDEHATTTGTAKVPLKHISNPSFRLPDDLAKPILMIAGGCGVAPIRGFLVDRLLQKMHNKSASTVGVDGKACSSRLYLGFRSPSDKVYRDLIQRSIDEGLLDTAKISYFDSSRVSHHASSLAAEDVGESTPNGPGRFITEHSCCLVSDLVQEDRDWVWDHIHNRNGYVYVCGGAATFGAAIEKELLDIIGVNTASHGVPLSPEEYLQRLIEEGRLCQDLAD